jgi:putative FmdB family regulatory protein
MPIYEYQCNDCRERQEVIQSFSDAPLEHCPKCGGTMKKLISSPAIQFKGSGFYKTDYASASSKAPETKSSEAKPSESKSSESKSSESKSSESKSETKSESKSGSGSKAGD